MIIFHMIQLPIQTNWKNENSRACNKDTYFNVQKLLIATLIIVNDVEFFIV